MQVEAQGAIQRRRSTSAGMLALPPIPVLLLALGPVTTAVHPLLSRRPMAKDTSPNLTHRSALAPVTAPLCAPSASMPGTKHTRWSYLCFRP